MIHFSEQIGFWSKFTFWFVIINSVVSLVFVIVVMIGGIADIRYLLQAMREEPTDHTDDGRVGGPPATAPDQTATVAPVRADS